MFQRAKAKIRALKGVPDIEEHLTADGFDLRETVRHGFPHSATALAVDNVQGLIAVGNRRGVIRIFGKLNVEVSFKHDIADQQLARVLHLAFLVNEGFLLSVTADNVLHLWNLKDNTIVEARSLKFEQSVAAGGSITALCAPLQSSYVYIGTSAGNVFAVKTDTFEVSGYTIYWNKTIELSQRKRPGSVNSILEHPEDNGKLLLSYDNLVVLWDLKAKAALFRCPTKEAVRAVDWYSDGKEFMTGLRNGSLAIWSSKDGKLVRIIRPHSRDSGDLSCHGIHKLQWKSTKDGPITFFTGGLPVHHDSAANTLTILSGSQALNVLHFDSRVIDFCCLTEGFFSSDVQDPHSVVVLLENGMEVVDLQCPSKTKFPPPSDISLQTPAVTAVLYKGNISPEVIGHLASAGSKQAKRLPSRRKWPVFGGAPGRYAGVTCDIIITGHVDGTVRFWDASSTTIAPLYEYDTATLYEPRMSAAQRPRRRPSSEAQKPAGQGKSPTPDAASPGEDEVDGFLSPKKIATVSNPTESWHVVDDIPQEGQGTVEKGGGDNAAKPEDTPAASSPSPAPAATPVVAKAVDPAAASSGTSTIPVATPVTADPKAKAPTAAPVTPEPKQAPTAPAPPESNTKAPTAAAGAAAATTTPEPSTAKTPEAISAEMPGTEPAELAAAPLRLRYPFAVRHMHFCSRSLTLTVSNEMSSVLISRFDPTLDRTQIQVQEVCVCLEIPSCPLTVKALDGASSSVITGRPQSPADGTDNKSSATVDSASASPTPYAGGGGGAQDCAAPWKCRVTPVDKCLGLRPVMCVQCYDPSTGFLPTSPVSCLAVDMAHEILALGSADGVGVFDIQRQSLILTSPPADLKDLLAGTLRETAAAAAGAAAVAPSAAAVAPTPGAAASSVTVATAPAAVSSQAAEAEGADNASEADGKTKDKSLRSSRKTSMKNKLFSRSKKSKSKTDISVSSIEEGGVSNMPKRHSPAGSAGGGDEVASGDEKEVDAPAGAIPSTSGQSACQCLMVADSYSHQATSDHSRYTGVWCATADGDIHAVTLVPTENLATGKISWGVYYHSLQLPVCKEESISDMAILDSTGKVLTPKFANPDTDYVESILEESEAGKKTEPFHFLVVCSDQHTWVYAMPSCGRETHKYPDETYIVKSAIVDINGSACLSALSLDGRLLAYSLPSMTPLLDSTMLNLPVGVDIRTVRSFAWANGGPLIYMPSPSEIQRLTMLKANSLNLPRSLPMTYIGRQFPKRQEKGFFSTLFASSQEQMDRDELFGRDKSGIASQSVAKRQPTKFEQAQASVAESKDVFSRARQNLDERGDKLNDLGEKTADLSANAGEFARQARLLAEQYRDRPWWQVF